MISGLIFLVLSGPESLVIQTQIKITHETTRPIKQGCFL